MTSVILAYGFDNSYSNSALQCFTFDQQQHLAVGDAGVFPGNAYSLAKHPSNPTLAYASADGLIYLVGVTVSGTGPDARCHVSISPGHSIPGSQAVHVTTLRGASGGEGLLVAMNGDGLSGYAFNLQEGGDFNVNQPSPVMLGQQNSWGQCVWHTDESYSDDNVHVYVSGRCASSTNPDIQPVYGIFRLDFSGGLNPEQLYWEYPANTRRSGEYNRLAFYGAFVFELFRGGNVDGLGIHRDDFKLLGDNNDEVQNAPYPALTKCRNIATLPDRQSVYLNYVLAPPGTGQASGYCRLIFNADTNRFNLAPESCVPFSGIVADTPTNWQNGVSSIVISKDGSHLAMSDFSHKVAGDTPSQTMRVWAITGDGSLSGEVSVAFGAPHSREVKLLWLTPT